MTDDEWIEQFLKEAETDDFGIAVFLREDLNHIPRVACNYLLNTGLR